MTEAAPPPNEADRPGLLAAFSRQRRASDFGVLVAAAAVAMLACVLAGAMAAWAALSAGLALALFAAVFFTASGGMEREAIRTEAEAADAASRRLRTDSERAFRKAMVEALPEPAIYVDAQGKVEAANAAARRQFHILGAAPLLTVAVRRPELVDAVDRARRGGEARFFEFVQRDEPDLYFSGVATPLATPTSSGVLVSLHDLTAIKRAELARVDFLANASHELRTPLTSLSGFIETLRGPARDDPAARERFLEIMQGQAERMRRLIQDLLSLSRIELAEHRPPDGEADLAAVAAEAGAALQPVASERGVKLRISGPATGVLVVGARDELAQVAQNLIDNAIKYSEAGGVVEIEVASGLGYEDAVSRAGRCWADAGHMSIAVAPGSAPPAAPLRYAVLRVGDSGPGIDRQHLPRLSERFYRVDPGRGLRAGTGLGLAIVKHVVARHRGGFLVESEPGRGSAFGVMLPVREAVPAK